MFRPSHRMGGAHNFIYRKFDVDVNQTIPKGVPVIMAAGLVQIAGNGASAVLGISNHAITTTGTVVSGTDVLEVILPMDIVFEADVYTGGSKTTFTDADLGTKYDIRSGGLLIDPDDTTGGFCRLYKYNNTTHRAWVLICNQLLTYAA